MNLRKLLAMLAIALLVLPASIQAAEKKVTPVSLPGVKVIDADTVKNWLDDGEDMFLLDARKAPDYEAGHLPDAVRATVPSDLNVSAAAIDESVEALKAYDDVQNLEKDTKIITYCNGST